MGFVNGTRVIAKTNGNGDQLGTVVDATLQGVPPNQTVRIHFDADVQNNSANIYNVPTQLLRKQRVIAKTNNSGNQEGTVEEPVLVKIHFDATNQVHDVPIGVV